LSTAYEDTAQETNAAETAMPASRASRRLRRIWTVAGTVVETFIGVLLSA
jgi:hypothetical protein